MKKQKVLVMGGGPAGLSVAWKAIQYGFDVELFEAGNILGGLSATLARDGYRFDLGGHRLITHNQELLDQICMVAGDQFRVRQRKTQIVFKGNFLEQPLQMGDMLTKLNPLMMARCLLDFGLAWASNTVRATPDVSFEDWVVKRFGRTLYEIFFGPYTAKVWGCAPSDVSAEWAARRISVPSLWQLVRHMLPHRKKTKAKTLIKSYYYHDEGIGRVWERMGEDIVAQGGVIHLNHRVKKIATDGDQITHITVDTPDGPRMVAGDQVVSTIPLPALATSMEPALPPPVMEAVPHLRYRGILFLFIGIHADRVMDNDALYVPEPEYIFFRLEQPKLWSAGLVPAGKTSLCVEIAASEGDDLWNAPDEALLQWTLADLKRLGLVADAGMVDTFFVERCPDVYPVSAVDTEQHRQEILTHLAPFKNLHLCGRQGLFRYLNMDEVAEMGFIVAQNIASNQQVVDVDQLAREEEYLWLPGQERPSVANSPQSVARFSSA